MNYRCHVFLPALFAIACGTASHADVFTIATYTFNEANSVRTAEIVEGSHNLKYYRNDEFTKRAVLDIITDPDSPEPEKGYKYFDRSRTVGYLLGRPDPKGIAMGVTLPDKGTAPPAPNVDSTTIEFTWGNSDLRDISGYDGGPDLLLRLQGNRGAKEREELLMKPAFIPRDQDEKLLPGQEGQAPATTSRRVQTSENTGSLIGWGLPNRKGPDFVIFETGTWEGFSVFVRKEDSTTFSVPRYQFANYFDAVHNVNAAAYDLSDFGIKEGERITAIRIRNIFNSFSRYGSDRVDDPSGAGRVLYPGDPGYANSYTLLNQPGGTEFKTSDLDADILYIVGLHDIEPIEQKDTSTP